ncbi:hypothetical protein VTN77DRAFT_7540 [Rasamsonia byssochlamydoides]|uniref:uncharacterized protein n=1 Tax=Rasamsonia byssochlamydoides TaxID=89139 RepID=UPI003743D8F4
MQVQARSDKAIFLKVSHTPVIRVAPWGFSAFRQECDAHKFSGPKTAEGRSVITFFRTGVSWDDWADPGDRYAKQRRGRAPFPGCHLSQASLAACRVRIRLEFRRPPTKALLGFANDEHSTPLASHPGTIASALRTPRTSQSSHPAQGVPTFPGLACRRAHMGATVAQNVGGWLS